MRALYLALPDSNMHEIKGKEGLSVRFWLFNLLETLYRRRKAKGRHHAWSAPWAFGARVTLS